MITDFAYAAFFTKISSGKIPDASSYGVTYQSSHSGGISRSFLYNVCYSLLLSMNTTYDTKYDLSRPKLIVSVFRYSATQPGQSTAARPSPSPATLLLNSPNEISQIVASSLCNLHIILLDIIWNCRCSA